MGKFTSRHSHKFGTKIKRLQLIYELDLPKREAEQTVLMRHRCVLVVLDFQQFMSMLLLYYDGYPSQIWSLPNLSQHARSPN